MWYSYVTSGSIRAMCRSNLGVVAITLNTDEWKGKKVVLVSVPGAFTVRPHSRYLVWVVGPM